MYWKAFLFVVSLSVSAIAQDYKASLAEMPVHAEVAEDGISGIQVALVRAIAEVSGEEIEIGVYPFKRSMDNVIRDNPSADFHIPLIKNEIIPEEELPYYYSTETIFHVNFVLYTQKGSDVKMDNLSQYTIETDAAHVIYFPFETLPSSSIENSLKKVNSGRIDGFLFADTPTDPVLKELGYENIQRRLYKVFEVKIILPKTERGKEVDKMLIKAIGKLRESGKLKEIEGPVDQPFKEW